MKFYPNSNCEPLKEFNPNHEPKGKATGGQFAKKQFEGEGGGQPQSQVSSSDRAAAAAVAARMAKPAEPDPMDKPAGHNITRISGSGDFEGHDVRTIAKNLVRGSDVKFTVDIETEDGDGGSEGSDDGFEFDASNYESRDTKRNYEQYQEERLEAAGEEDSRTYNRFVENILDNTEARHDEMKAIFDEVAAENARNGGGDPSLTKDLPLKGEPFSLVNATNFSTDGIMEEAYAHLQKSRDNELGQSGRDVRFDSSEGLEWSEKLTATEKEELRELFQNSPASHVYGAEFPYFDRDKARERNEQLDERDGFDRWREDGNETEPEMKSYHEWLRSEYEDSARQDYIDNNYSGDGDSSTSKVIFKYNGANGEQITRSMFRNSDGELEVHHDYFVVDMADSPKGLGKALFRSMVAEYERVGIERISVYANIDVGNYAWGKYGFEPDSPSSVISGMRSKLENTPVGTVMKYREGSQRGGDEGGTVTAVLTERRKKALGKLLGRADKVEAFWSVLDSDVPGTSERTGERSGSFKLGKWFMIQGRQSWDGHIDVNDTRGMNRLKTYIGAEGYLKKVKKGQKRGG